MDSIYFIDHVFIKHTPLNPTNILEYFSRSPFYDKSSNNEILKMQNQYRGVSSLDNIEKIKGMYYVLDYSNEENTLFIIRQSEYINQKTENISFYSVIYGYIYKAPSASKMFKIRTNEIFYNLNKILDFLVEETLFCKKDEELKSEEHNSEIPEEVYRDVLDLLDD